MAFMMRFHFILTKIKTYIAWRVRYSRSAVKVRSWIEELIDDLFKLCVSMWSLFGYIHFEEAKN